MSNQRGSLLVVSYLFIAFLISWATVSFRQGATELHASERFVDSRQSFNLAEAGRDDAVRYMRSLPSPPTGILAFDPFSGSVALGAGGTYAVTIDPDDANPSTYIDHFTITSTGQVTSPQTISQVLTVLRIESFARYAYFTNAESKLLYGSPTPMWFTSADRMYGPVHTNGQFNINGSPIFDGPISSVATSINYDSNGPNNPKFRGGLTLGAAPVTMPMTATGLRVAASGGGYWYTGNTTIVLQSNGTMLVTNTALGWVGHPTALPANGAIFVNGGDATVSGTLDGTLTIGASERILIPDHIDYKDNPNNNPNATDVLGLVAEKDIVIQTSAPNGLRIQASMMALNESFMVEDWWDPPPKGELRLYGGLIEQARGPVGTFNPGNGNLVSGYKKDYKYDARLATFPPPFFPTTGQYEDVMWQELQNN